jgi:hypothetical protein
MNLDFSAEPAFSWYVVLLMVSGVALVGTASTRHLQDSKGLRIFTMLVGLGFFGYGFYLGFLFDGGTYIIFYKALIVPVVLIVGAVRSMLTRRRAAALPPPAVHPVAGTPYGQPWGQPVAAPGQPAATWDQPGVAPAQPGAAWGQPGQASAAPGIPGQPGQPGAGWGPPPR